MKLKPRYQQFIDKMVLRASKDPDCPLAKAGPLEGIPAQEVLRDALADTFKRLTWHRAQRIVWEYLIIHGMKPKVKTVHDIKF